MKTVDTWRQGAWMGAVGGELHVGRVRYDGERRTDGVPWDVLHQVPQIPAAYAEQCASQYEVPDEVAAAVESVVAVVRRLKDAVSAGRRSAQAVDTSLPGDLRRMGEVGTGFGGECCECGRPGVVVTAGYAACLHCGRLTTC